MTEDDTQAVADIKSQSGFDYSSSWERQGQTASWLQGEFPQYSFIDDMWKAYRNRSDAPPPRVAGPAARPRFSTRHRQWSATGCFHSVVACSR